MKRQLICCLNLLAAVSLTVYIFSSGLLKAQSNFKEIEITDQEGKSTILYESSHALVIWAGNYQHWSRLNNVEVEAKQVVNALEQRGFEVTIVGNPTSSELRSSIKDFIDNYGYKPDNRLVIFFTGHGHTRNQTKGYLVPVDAPDPYTDEQGFLKHAFSMQWMISWAREIEAKHALFVFDSCFSGTVFKTKALPRLENAYIRDVTAKPVRQFIAAGDADQEVPAKSIFTPLFIRGLEGEADYTEDGYITGSELGLYLTQTLREYTSKQTPQYGKIRDVELDRGDIVFRSLNKPIFSNLPSQSQEITPPEEAKKSPAIITIEEVNLRAKQITVSIDGAGVGSGFLIDYSDNVYTVLTNWQVVKNSGDYIVQTVDGRTYQIDSASIKQLPGLDLAVLQFTSNENYQLAKFGDSANLHEGQSIYFTGYPERLRREDDRYYRFFSASLVGILPKSTENGYSFVYNGEAFPGISGGPVFNQDGLVIGVHGESNIHALSGGTSNYAIPINLFKERYQELFR